MREAANFLCRTLSSGQIRSIACRYESSVSWRGILFSLARCSSVTAVKQRHTILSLQSSTSRASRLIRNATAHRSPTFILMDFSQRLVLIGGTSYAGETKKSAFTIMNYLLPQRGVMSMHCSANVGAEGDVAIFFGLSGTGKTTLSADPERRLIGDDEHGWSDDGVFNFEGGCYAKVIKLSAEAEPDIYRTTKMFGTILENVVYDPATRQIDLDDARKTENTRASYPLTSINNIVPEGQCRTSAQHHHADGRCVWRVAAGGAACRPSRRCITSFPVTRQKLRALKKASRNPKRLFQRALARRSWSCIRAFTPICWVSRWASTTLRAGWLIQAGAVDHTASGNE